MTEPLPAFCDDVELAVDVVEVNRFYMVVRDRATRREHSFSYDNILIGSSESGNCYSLTMPAWLARHEGLQP
jgi:hypothetical protein